MATIITGIVLKKNESVYGAKVFISDDKGNLLLKEQATITDADGKYKLTIPTENINGEEVLKPAGNYISFISNSPSAKATTPLVKGVTNYNFDTEFFKGVQEVPEFTVTGTKPAPKPTPAPTPAPTSNVETKIAPIQTKKYWWLLPAIIGLVCAGGLTYILIKNRKK
jgi:hypothetical protein